MGDVDIDDACQIRGQFELPFVQQDDAAAVPAHRAQEVSQLEDDVLPGALAKNGSSSTTRICGFRLPIRGSSA